MFNLCLLSEEHNYYIIKKKLPASSLIFLYGLNPLPRTPPITADVGNPSTIF